MDQTDSQAATPSFSAPRVLLITLGLVVAAAVAFWFGVNSVKPPELPALWMVGLDDPVEHRLGSQYTDADGDLVADPPADESQQLDPAIINFSYLATEQDRYADVWSSFLEFVGQQCGRTVAFVPQESAADQLRALRDGELHVAGVNSGSVPSAVNQCGFVPVCSFGSEGELATYTMRIIAGAKSPVRKLGDIRSSQLALTDTTSNSGWKAPMMLLLRDHKLKPIIDYDIVGLGSHASSINAIAAGEQEVAAVAGDELALAESRGQISKDDYVELYESDPFCNNVLGYVHTLKPELAEAIEKAIYDFDWKDTKLADEFSTIGASQLVPVDYKKDFELIRQIDNAMGRRGPLEERRELAATPSEGN